ncbi:hypothetical protein [Halosimplex halophilum]|uniref:hypothetical protein n=1 Tax=Halosimplex halophilum TaxID=2559572 RepID=UPI0014354D22|nr:hypothetical protein [Halosimplex halophilum]
MVAGVFFVVLSATFSTAAFTGSDEAVDGVFLDPANTTNGDAYAEINDQGQLRIELTDLNPQATTTVDDVFTISSTNHRSRVWIEHDAGSDVTFYRSDTGTPIGGSGDRVVLGENETVPVGLRIDAGSESVVLTQITVHAEIRPTATASPTTVAAGPGQSTPAPTPEPTPVPTAPPTTTATPTTEQPTTTAAPTTDGPTSTDGGSTSTDDGSTPTDDGGSTPDGTTAPPETTVPPTTAPPTTAPPTTSPPPTTAPATTAPPDDESPTPTASTPTTEPDEGSPTATAPPVTTAPRQEAPGTTADPGVTVSTPDGDTEIGGLSPVQLGGVVAALAALALGLFAWGLLGSSSALVLVADAGEGLDVRPQSLADGWYDTREDGFAFRFAESDPWAEAAGDGPVTFEQAVTVTNTGSDAARVIVADAESLPGVGLSAEGVDLTGDGLVLDSGESADLTLALPADFDPDGEVTVRFRRTPVA